MFNRYIGIDYSGAETPTSSLKGIRVYMCTIDTDPEEVQPSPSPRKYWTRKGLAQWLVERLNEDIPTIVGIDHGFSFPMKYFIYYQIKPHWDIFLDDFCKHWPTDEDHMYVCFVRDGCHGDGASRKGSPGWKRIAEERTGRAKSVFHFNVPGTVASSTHAGIPWLRFIRQNVSKNLHLWPFDGWDVPEGKSVIAEVYPSLWNRTYPKENRTSDQHDAWTVATWFKETDLQGKLKGYFKPELHSEEEAAGRVEGWILGVM